MINITEKYEADLDSFDIEKRQAALVQLAALLKNGTVRCKPDRGYTNIHFHSFFSFNYRDFSPSKIAWLSRKEGLAVSGIVDFDVLDGLDELLSAAHLLNIRACAGMETRVFVPEFAKEEINSPGEPGISYHMGAGFPVSVPPAEWKNFLKGLRDTSNNRNRGVVEKVNEYLSPIKLDYEKDVWPLTPSKNATERHICLAYAKKAAAYFNDKDELLRFWSEKLGQAMDASVMPEGVSLLNAIRAKTMKKGGVGYVQPSPESFPEMAKMNEFILAMGGIPTLAWLNGLSEGERQMERLLKTAMKSGVAAVNIIPDRNYTPGQGKKDKKLTELYNFTELCNKYNLPIIAGTEMNSFGQKFVDDFETEELKPLLPTFLKGALIVYAHSVLYRKTGLGYAGQWAAKNFDTTERKNIFFETIGKKIMPSNENLLAGIDESFAAKQILDRIS